MEIILIKEFANMNLKHYIQNIKKKGLTSAEIRYIFNQLNRAIKYFRERGHIHTCISNENVFLQFDERGQVTDDFRVKIADFGALSTFEVNSKFQLNVYNDGSKTIEEIKTKSTQIVNKVLDNGHGTEELTDYILDAHGNGIQNALVQAYKYNPTLDDYELECQDNTTLEGQFNLNLNKGKYKLVITCDGFQKNTQVIDV